MHTTIEAPATHELLARFTNPSHAVMKDVLVTNNYRGDCTETGERRLRAMLGAAYDSLHHDTVACSGRIVVIMPRFKAPGAVEAPCGFHLLTAPHYWALGEIDEKSPEVSKAKPSTVQRVPIDIAQQLYALPGFEFVEVKNVNFWEHANGPAKRKKRPAPADVVYFRFNGGYGVVAC